MENLWFLRRESFFADLPELEALFTARARRLEVRKGDIIFFEGEAGDCCYYLQSGLVQIFGTTDSGKEAVFFLRTAGEVFGLSEVLAASARTANAQALSPCVIHALAHEPFEELLASNYQLARRVITILGRRLRYMGSCLRSQSGDVQHRLCRLLIALAYDTLENAEDWSCPCALPHPLSQERMAAMIGSTQPSVSAALRLLRDEGLVSLHGRKIRLEDPLRLLLRLESMIEQISRLSIIVASIECTKSLVLETSEFIWARGCHIFARRSSSISLRISAGSL